MRAIFFFITFGLSLFSLEKSYGSQLESNDTVVLDIAQDTLKLLPQKYLFTQKVLWGNRGLMRNINIFKLTPESRDLELNIRRTMITVHQYSAYAALLGMIGTGITGQQLYTGKQSVKDLHEGIAGFTNGCYFSSLGLALFAPPLMKDRAKGISNVKIHRALSIIHVASMISTNVLSGMIEDNPNLKPYHRAAAISAFSSLFLATIVINL